MSDLGLDTQEPPLGIRTLTTQDGQTRYQARVHCRLSHKQYTQRFTNLAEAIQWRQKVVTLLESGMDPTAISRKHKRKTESLKSTPPPPSESATECEAPQPTTIRELIENFIKHRNYTTPIPANRLTDYLRVLDDFGDHSFQDLRNEDLVNYIALMRTKPLKRYMKNKKNKSKGGSSQPTTYKDASIRKFIYAMKVALQWNAKNRGIQFNPHLFSFGQSEMPAAWDENRQRRLHPAEESKLYQAADVKNSSPYTRRDWEHLIGFALETAMRAQEIALATWDNVSASGTQLNIPKRHSKTKNARTVLLSLRAREILKAQKDGLPEGEKRIFYQFRSSRALCASFARLTTRAGIEDLHLHDLRHEATSRLCESGKLKQMAIMEMTGHKGMVTFQNYVHLIQDGLKTQLD
jgi:integrase